MRAMAMFAALAACAPDRTVATVHPQQDKIETKEAPAVPNKDVDILFVIDDSGSMEEEQTSLRENFSRFIDVLDSIPGGRPNVQIGVITPNLGTTAIDGSTAPTLGTCTSTGGERGVLRPLGSGGPRFLRDVARTGGGRDTNFSGTLEDAFSQLANVGFEGCGVEQHLEAMKRALDGNPSNAGFVRDDAYLAVIVIADEDDCSLSNASLFDTPRDISLNDVLSLRCAREGVVCATPSTPFDQATGVRTDCRARADSQVVTPIDRYVELLKSKKRDPRDVIVAGIVGDPEPFEITTSPGTTRHVLKPSCTYEGPTEDQFAFPAVRTADFLAQFPNTARTTICDGDLSDGLEEIGKLLARTIINVCFDYTLVEPYDCSVTEVRRRPGAPDEELRVLPACGTGALPCWRIEADPVECFYTQTKLKLVVDRGGVVPDADIRVRASCATGDASGPLQ